MVLFTVQIAEGKAIEDALTYANVAASLSTGKNLEHRQECRPQKK